MKRIFLSIDLWLVLVLFSLMAGLVGSEAGSKYFNFTISGMVLILIGATLGLIHFQHGPSPGVLASIIIGPNGEHIHYIPGEEFKKFGVIGIYVGIVGTIITILGATV